MDNIRVRCRSCGMELEGHQTKTATCGCSNMTTIRGDKITALDLSQVVMLNNIKTTTNNTVLSPGDLEYQEARRKRKVRKLNFEVR